MKTKVMIIFFILSSTAVAKEPLTVCPYTWADMTGGGGAFQMCVTLRCRGKADCVSKQRSAALNRFYQNQLISLVIPRRPIIAVFWCLFCILFLSFSQEYEYITFIAAAASAFLACVPLNFNWFGEYLGPYGLMIIYLPLLVLFFLSRYEVLKEQLKIPLMPMIKKQNRPKK